MSGSGGQHTFAQLLTSVFVSAVTVRTRPPIVDCKVARQLCLGNMACQHIASIIPTLCGHELGESRPGPETPLPVTNSSPPAHTHPKRHSLLHTHPKSSCQSQIPISPTHTHKPALPAPTASPLQPELLLPVSKQPVPSPTPTAVLHPAHSGHRRENLIIIPLYHHIIIIHIPLKCCLKCDLVT